METDNSCLYSSFKIIRLLIFCVCTLLLSTLSCKKIGSVESQKYNEIKWVLPSTHKYIDKVPVYPEISYNGQFLVTQYFISKKQILKTGDSGSQVLILDLNSSEARWEEYFPPVRPMILMENWIQIVSHAKPRRAKIFDLNSLTIIEKDIPGPFFNSVNMSPWLISSVGNDNSLWLKNNLTGKVYDLPSSQHNLPEGIITNYTNERLIIFGERKDPNETKLLCTQLWSLPDFKNIVKYETKSDDFYSWNFFPPKLLGQDYFCFTHELGVCNIVDIHSGEILYSISTPEIQEKNILNERSALEMFEGIKYVVDTQKIAWYEVNEDNIEAFLKTCNAKTGKNIQFVPIDKATRVEIIKISGTWYILCEYVNTEKQSIFLNLYSMSDLKLSGSFDEIPWTEKYNNRIYKNGKQYLIYEDRVLILDLSKILAKSIR